MSDPVIFSEDWGSVADAVGLSTDYGIIPVDLQACLVGSFALAGQDAGLKAGRKLVCAVGSFTLTGEDATLTVTESSSVTEGFEGSFPPTDWSGTWHKDTAVFHAGAASAASHATSMSSNISVTKIFTEFNDVSFWWESSTSNQSIADLNFLIDNVNKEDAIPLPTAWSQKSYRFAPSTYALKWEYIKTEAAPLAYLDDVTTDTITFGTPDYTEDFEGSFPPAGWSTSGDANWFKDTGVFYEGAASAGSGNIGDDQQSNLEYSRTWSASAKVRFRWKVSSESRFDFLRFLIDGAIVAQNTPDTSSYSGVGTPPARYDSNISGAVDWEYRLFTIPAGAHTLTWRYEKDSSDESGSDMGWLDQVEFIF